MDLRTKIADRIWSTPIGLASGTCGYGSELDGLADWSAVGAIFTKGLSNEPRTGHPPPRIYETPSGMLNAIGLENVGVEVFLKEKMPFLRNYRAQFGGRVFVNLFATSLDEYTQLTARLESEPDIDGVEINLSCPNVKAGGIEFGRTPAGCEQVTRVVRNATRKFVAVKLSPASPVADNARASEAAGADAICMGNTMPAMSIDIKKRKAQLSAKIGGLSGPALRPIAVRMTYDVARAVKIPVIGIGGITNGDDALEFILAGASAVQIGTALFANPNAAKVVQDGIVRYLEEYRTTLEEIRGQLS